MAVTYRLPDRPEAKEELEKAIELARGAITEGRNTVQDLRSFTLVPHDLAQAIATVGEGLASDQTSEISPEFHVYVEGKSSDITPIVRDEVYRIACESLRNAFRHAHAKRIDVRIRYDKRQFWIQVVDNGKGIDPAVLTAGRRAGHHGLPGIHERAELAGGKLSVRSRLNSGTEIELTIPATTAYVKSRSPQTMSAGKGS